MAKLPRKVTSVFQEDELAALLSPWRRVFVPGKRLLRTASVHKSSVAMVSLCTDRVKCPRLGCTVALRAHGLSIRRGLSTAGPKGC